MKKILSILVLFLCMFTVNVYALNVDITNVELESKTNLVEETSNPSIDGSNITFNLRFKDEEQKVVYKIDVKNNTKNEYNIDGSFDNNIIKYKILSEDTILKANESKSIKLQVYYEDEIDEALYVDKSYKSSSVFSLKFTTSNEKVKGIFENPKTGVFTYSLLMILLAILSVILFIRIKENKYFRTFMFVLLLILPVIVIAEESMNATIDGKTNMEFVEPNRAIFDIGTVVNTKMREVTGETQQCRTYGSYTYCSFNSSNSIKNITRSNELQDGATEVQSEDSDYKIYIWFDDDSKILYYYSDADIIYYNENSSGFYKNLAHLEDLELFHTKYLRDASSMFSYTGEKVTSGVNLYMNMKTKNVTNMNSMFTYFHYGISEEHDNTLELGELFTADSATDIGSMFNGFLYGDYNNRPHGSLDIKFNDNFNACSAETADYFFGFAGFYLDDVNVHLGKNFNISSANKMNDFFYNAFYTGGNINIDLGDNFNCSSATDLRSFLYRMGNQATGNINIDFGKNLLLMQNQLMKFITLYMILQIIMKLLLVLLQ